MPIHCKCDMANWRIVETIQRPLLLLLLVYITGMSTEQCGTKFVDPQSSTVMAQIVFQGTVGTGLSTGTGETPHKHRAAVTIGGVYKGEHILRSMNVEANDTVLVDSFGTDNNLDECVAPMTVIATGGEWVFFLRTVQSSFERRLQLTALPLPADDTLTQTIRESLCNNQEGCTKPPEIMTIRCKQCLLAARVKRLRSRQVKRGKSGRLRCTTYGNPFPSFSWLKDGEPVVSGSGGIIINSREKSSILSVRRVTRAHVGEYTCVARNSLGESEMRANLTIEHPETEASREPEDITPAPSRGRHGPGRCFWSADLYCENGGICHSSRDHSYCNCAVGFAGTRCEIDLSTSTVSLRDDTLLDRDTNNGSGLLFNKLFSNDSVRIEIADTQNNTSIQNSTVSLERIDTFTEASDLPSISTDIPNVPDDVSAMNTTRSDVQLSNASIGTSINTTQYFIHTETPVTSNGRLVNNILPKNTQHLYDSTYISTTELPETTSAVVIAEDDTQQTPDASPTKAMIPTARSTPTRKKSRKRHPAQGKIFTNVDEEARKLIVARLKTSRLKSSWCKEKRYCLNRGKCRNIHKLGVKVCICRDGYSGPRCELNDNA